MQGFYLFRRYLATPGVDFWYANSCNEQSGVLWSKSKGLPVAHSDEEYLFVYRPGPVLMELAMRRGVPARWAAPVRWAGSTAGVVVRPRRPRTTFRVEPCIDWERLADLSERCRDPKELTCDRSAAYLRWRYARAETPAGQIRKPDVYRFEGGGAEGWFALGHARRGQEEQIRSVALLDAVWPRDKATFAEVLAAVIATGAAEADVLSLRPRPGFALSDGLLGLRKRMLPSPEAYVIASASQVQELTSAADFATADRI